MIYEGSLMYKSNKWISSRDMKDVVQQRFQCRGITTSLQY